MLTTIKGIYDNGQIVLDEIPPTINKSKVVITFLEEIQPSPFEILPVSNNHIFSYQKVPSYEDQRDPFDRLLLATAFSEKYQLFQLTKNSHVIGLL